MRRAVGLLACALLAACSAAKPVAIDLARADVPRQAVDVADASQAAQAVNAFGFDLLRTIGTGQGMVLSPASIAISLGMARAGARGSTAADMDRVLHAAASEEHPTWLNALDVALSSRSGTFTWGNEQKVVALRVANAPFAQKGERWDPAFLDELASRFGAGIQLVDYRTAAEPARQAINSWVSNETEQRIPQLLGPGTIDESTRLVLVNAIYLKAPWASPFLELDTHAAPFTRPDGTTVAVATMHQEVQADYAAGSGWQAVDLPYLGGALTMTLILPTDLRTFVAGLDGPAFDVITARLVNHLAEVTLSLPTFGIDSSFSLRGRLGDLGMGSAFESGADFSGMTSDEGLVLDDVIHSASISVDEDGTEAAAATGTITKAIDLIGEQVTISFDRPFVFALRDRPTGAVVFLGVVTDPSIGSVPRASG